MFLKKFNVKFINLSVVFRIIDYSKLTTRNKIVDKKKEKRTEISYM